MFLARREYGKYAKVYELRDKPSFFWPSEWAFSAKRTDGAMELCGQGHCAIGATRTEALVRLEAAEMKASGITDGG